MTCWTSWHWRVNSFSSLSIRAALKHHSVGAEFESETREKDTTTVTPSWPACRFLRFPVFRRVCDVERGVPEKNKQNTRRTNSSTGNEKRFNRVFLGSVHALKNVHRHCDFCVNEASVKLILSVWTHYSLRPCALLTWIMTLWSFLIIILSLMSLSCTFFSTKWGQLQKWKLFFEDVAHFRWRTC